MSFVLIGLREVRQRIPRSRSTVYSEIARGLFPRPIKAGKSSFWLLDEIEDLIRAYAAGATEAELQALCRLFYERRRRG